VVAGRWRTPGTEGDDVHGLGPTIHTHPEALGQDLHHRAGRHEFVQCDLQVLAEALIDRDVPLGHHGGHRPGTRDDAVRDRAVGHRVQRFDALDLQCRTADPVDLRTHLDQHLADVDDLRLAGGVVDHRCALGQNRRHEQVLGGTHAREVQPDRRAVQLPGLGDQEPVLTADLGAESGQAVDVHVQATRSDGVSTGQRHIGLTDPRHQRAQHTDRGPHLAHEVVVGLMRRHRGYVDQQGPGGGVVLHVAAEPAQQLGHDRHVEDVRDLGESGRALVPAAPRP
jgi:hypothetical protein